MRTDVSKAITERERRGGRIKAPKGERKEFHDTPLDEQPKSESMTKKWIKNWRSKQFTDVLAPLEGFLRKNVNRPWDKVTQEMNAVLPAGGGVSLSHARDHFFQFVEQNVTAVVRGVPYDLRGPSWKRFYVDPQSKLLRESMAPIRRWKYHSHRTNPPKDADGHLLLKDEKGIWYAVEVQPVHATQEPFVFDVFLQERPTFEKLIRTYGRAVYGVNKTQLSSRTIKRYKLNPLDKVHPQYPRKGKRRG